MLNAPPLSRYDTPGLSFLRHVTRYAPPAAVHRRSQRSAAARAQRAAERRRAARCARCCRHSADATPLICLMRHAAAICLLRFFTPPPPRLRHNIADTISMPARYIIFACRRERLMLAFSHDCLARAARLPAPRRADAPRDARGMPLPHAVLPADFISILPPILRCRWLTLTRHAAIAAFFAADADFAA